ncbi:unnamed protein product [Orchesella dallaii]|uniref:Gustatory receptor n=1 Tax=Orchesella dallaii TaxID=48710 RepID=A0ABP1R0G2_9HEXA
MFTPKNFKILALVTNLAYLSGAVPYHFVKKAGGESVLIFAPTRGRTAFVRVVYSLNLFYICFIAFRVFQKVVLENEEASLAFLVKMGYLFAKYLLPAEQRGKCMKFFITVMIIGIAVCIQNTVLIMKKPFQVHFFTIAVKHPRTDRRLREMKTCTGLLRSIQMLHRIWQLNFQHWFCPSHKATTIIVATLSLYGVIKLSGPRAIIMGFVALLCLMYLSTLFYKFGQFHEMSKKTLENWRNLPKTGKWMKKFLKSVPVFSIGIGNFYFVKKTTVVIILDGVLNNTITLFFL